MLKPATFNIFSKRIQLASIPVIINRKPKYEILWIVDFKIDYQQAYKLLYKVIWYYNLKLELRLHLGKDLRKDKGY